ncbi:hypothetical protein Pint_07324 [Pistacia integerrima]|uniref:Uncharacterized protein n=1 Tax=Pistacia integerrima TaxID=434235 RepID=A0ACC0XUV8_9ROSI|nr:hypothetical protein Pint_07324 [Pistacia integerrima]
MVCSFLHICAHHIKNRVLSSQLARSGETVSRNFHAVLNAILRMHTILLKEPEPITEDSTDERWKWFKNCLGTLDGTHIRVQVPAHDKPRYRTRKNEIATNVLTVCTPKMQFIYILPGWEGSATDGRVLRDAISRRNGLKFPQAVVFWFWLISSTVGLWLLLQPTCSVLFDSVCVVVSGSRLLLLTSSSNKRKRNDDGISEMVDQMKKWRDTYEVASRGMEKVAAVFDKSEDRSQRLFAKIEELGLLTPTETIDVLEVMCKDQHKIDVFMGLPESLKRTYVLHILNESNVYRPPFSP